ncbi:MAG TPA: AI-2E family transporter [Patescibacteria group bacterium]|jgi:predicted PurR-regulated permease PerM
MNINIPRILAIELAIIAGGVILYFAGGLLSEFASIALVIAFSTLLTYALLPAVNRLDRFKYVPRGAAILVTYAGLILALVGFVALISVPLSDQGQEFAENYPEYQRQLESGIPETQRWLDDHKIGYDLQASSDKFVDKLEISTDVVVSRTGSIISGFFGTLSSMFFVLFVTAYFLHSGHRFVERLIMLFPKRRHRFVRKLTHDYDRILGRYVRGQLIISGVVALAVGLFTSVIGLPYSVIIGLIAGITALIPVIGALLGMVIPVVIAALVNPILIPVFIAFFLILNEITDKVLYPRVVGRAVELHPLIVFFGLLVGVQVAGIAGALLATPVLGLLKVTLVALNNSTGYARN